MKPSRKKRPDRPLSDSYCADDGVDPRYYFSNNDRKRGFAEERILSAALEAAEIIVSFQLEDPSLQGLVVESAKSVRGGRGVEIALSLDSTTDKGEIPLIKSKLPAVARIIRSELAQMIQRRRTPEIILKIEAKEGEGHEPQTEY